MGENGVLVFPDAAKGAASSIDPNLLLALQNNGGMGGGYGFYWIFLLWMMWTQNGRNGIIAHESLSKEQACRHLNIRRSRFDDLVREGKIPKGRKVVGYTGLVWYKDELDIAVNK